MTVAAGLFYAFTLLGSVSLGYLVLRFVYPEIRTFDKKEKLLTAFVVGAAITLTALVIDYALTGARVLNLDSFSMPLVFLTSGFYFVALRTYFLYASSTSGVATIGVPIPSISLSVPQLPKLPKLSKKEEKKEPGAPVAVEAKTVVEQEMKKVEKRISEELKKEKKAELDKLEEEKKELEQKLSQAVGKGEEKTREKEKLDQQLRDLSQQVEKEREAQKKRQEELKRNEQEKKELEKKLEEEKKSAEQQKLLEQHRRQAEQKRREIEKKQEEERRKRLKESIGESQTYLEKITARVEELKKKKGKSVKKAAAKAVSEAEVKEAKKVEELKKQAIEKPVEVKLEINAPVVAPPVALPAPAPVAVPAPVSTAKHPEKKGILDWLLGGKKEKKEEPTFATWRDVKEQEKKKQIEKKKLLEKRKAEEREVEELVKTVAQKAEEQEAEGVPVHRRYLLKKQEVKVVASKEVAKKEEFGVMMEDIYSQLKTSQRETKASDVLSVDVPRQVVKPETQERREGKIIEKEEKQEKPAPLPAAARPEAGVSVSDILGGDLFAPQSPQQPQQQAQELFPPEGAATQAGDIFAQLSQAAAGTAAPVKSDVSFVQIEEKNVSCPTCHSKNSKIIFCPYCSTGMCANCSPSIKPIGVGQFVYVCPKCSEEVSVKKKAG